jgi:acetoacetyl-CoA synthetase
VGSIPHFMSAANMTDPESSETKELWRHSNPERTTLHKFKELISSKFGVGFPTYHDLWQWSVNQPASFWEEVWHFTGIRAHEPYKEV